MERGSGRRGPGRRPQASPVPSGNVCGAKALSARAGRWGHSRGVRGILVLKELTGTTRPSAGFCGGGLAGSWGTWGERQVSRGLPGGGGERSSVSVHRRSQSQVTWRGEQALPRQERRWGHDVVFRASKRLARSPGFTRGHTRQVRGQSEVWETPWLSWESWTKKTRSWTDQRSRCGASNGWQAELK